MAEFENHYRRLRRAQERLDAAEAHRRAAVIEAREAGLTFGEIGECLAVSRQAARALMLRTIEADRE